MKRKLLIIGIRLTLAGIEKSFIEFINKINFDEFDVTLLLAKKEGELLSQIPDNVNIIDMGDYGNLFLIDKNNAKEIIKKYYIKGSLLKYFKLFIPVLRIILSKGDKRTYNKHRLWLKLIEEMAPIDEYYDIAIDYWGDRTLFYLVEKVINVKVKISWMHFDFFYHPREKFIYENAFNRIDKLVCVNEYISNQISTEFKDIEKKVVYIDNFTNGEKIVNEAKQSIDEEIDENNSLITVGRIENDKGYDRVIKSLKTLCEINKKIKWYIIGNDNTTFAKEFKKMLYENKVYDHVVFLGEKLNPYPYIYKSRVYVQPSRTEASPIAIKEAICLKKNIVVSDIPTIKKTIDNFVDNWEENIKCVNFDEDCSTEILQLMDKIDINYVINDYNNNYVNKINTILSTNFLKL